MKKILSSTALVLLGSLITLGIVFAQGATKKFPDVDYNSWYGDAVNYWYMQGVIAGYPNGNFGPSDAVNRAQLMTILKAYDDQLVTPYHNGSVGKLQSLICDGIKKDALTNTDTKALFDEVCTVP